MAQRPKTPNAPLDAPPPAAEQARAAAPPPAPPPVPPSPPETPRGAARPSGAAGPSEGSSAGCCEAEARAEGTTEVLVGFLERSKKVTQRVSSAGWATVFYRARSRLVSANKAYAIGKEMAAVRGPFGEEDGQARGTKETLALLQGKRKTLQDKMLQLNVYYSELSKKKLLRMHDSIDSLATDGFSDVVEYSYNDARYKQKKCSLHANFLIIASLSSQYRDVLYLFTPSVRRSLDTVVVVNASHYFRFATPEQASHWEQALAHLRLWVEVIPRTIIDQETGGAFDRPSPFDHAASPLVAQAEHAKQKKPKKKDRRVVRIFNVSLEEYAQAHQTEAIPPPIRALIDRLKAVGTETEGIFRICGGQDVVMAVRSRLEHNDLSVIDEADVHSLASALKQYIREFPSQVVPLDIDQNFKELFKVKDALDPQEVFARYVAILATLPPIIVDFIKQLCGLLHEILRRSDINKMTVSNIFICLGPALRGCPFCYNYATTNFPAVFNT